jgi:DMSO/TMAO reductase YedYZ molybdopterin-dependent catalytic subunit
MSWISAAKSRSVAAWEAARPGIVAGSIAAMTMYAFFLVLRLAGGVPTPSEMYADASAPLIPVTLFGFLISLVGGYTQLKILGFAGVLFGALVVGAAGGVLAQRRTAHRPRFIWAFAAILFVLSIGAFWPVLQTSYYGIPPQMARLVTVAVLAAGYAIYGTVTLLLLRAQAPEDGVSRRRFLTGSIAAAAGLVGVGAWAELFRRASFPYDGQTVEGPGVGAITPNELFYVVTKNVTDPSVDRDVWRLRISGAVAQPLELDYARLTALPSVVQQTTLMCVNNDVAGGLMSNAEWKGVTLASLIAAARPSSDVKRVAFHSTDNYIETIPIAKAMESTTVLAYLMNGEPLPARHGFPARMLVPGYFGERNPKWVVGITLETTEFKGFYERQGWGPNFTVPTHARFDVPDFSKPIPHGTVELRGVAFAGNRGVRRVEVSADGGTSWSDAAFTSPYVPTAWRLWKYEWRATPGDHRLIVRATDGAGTPQVATKRPTAPEGATGLHEVQAHVV